ncbi:hypothetical protein CAUPRSCDRAFT_11862 [Caulochytrium protostelioides]|uniref:Uncharacterized protein n=1 Tax=Caulochytrium protostelioides TaxID=1555241 RepID=A0A4P9WWC0_9FUNG|nr:hypothetical protein CAUPRSCDRAFT_11862 [Caulochytrium protostelioides]
MTGVTAAVSAAPGAAERGRWSWESALMVVPPDAVSTAVAAEVAVTAIDAGLALPAVGNEVIAAAVTVGVGATAVAVDKAVSSAGGGGGGGGGGCVGCVGGCGCVGERERDVARTIFPQPREKARMGTARRSVAGAAVFGVLVVWAIVVALAARAGRAARPRAGSMAVSAGRAAIGDVVGVLAAPTTRGAPRRAWAPAGHLRSI